MGTARLRSFHGPGCFAVCAGMGADAGRRAAEAALAEFRPELMISAGFAGALVEELHVGDVIRPAMIVDELSGARFETGGGRGTMISSPQVASRGRKRDLAERFGAQAVDMEGASLAQAAREHGVRFMAVKAISDELDFPLLDFSEFTDPAGQLQRSHVAAYALIRPRLWPRLLRLEANCRRASRELCRALEHLISEGEEERGLAPGAVAEPRRH